MLVDAGLRCSRGRLPLGVSKSPPPPRPRRGVQGALGQRLGPAQLRERRCSPRPRPNSTAAAILHSMLPTRARLGRTSHYPTRWDMSSVPAFPGGSFDFERGIACHDALLINRTHLRPILWFHEIDADLVQLSPLLGCSNFAQNVRRKIPTISLLEFGVFPVFSGNFSSTQV